MVMTTQNYPFSPPADSDSASSTSTPEIQKAYVVDMAERQTQQQHQPQQQQHRHQPQPQPQPQQPGNSRPDHSSLTRVQGALRRSRAPPRNQDGDIYCDHPNCRDSSQTFRRLCEWNKHMDRHERPYKCLEPECELNPGFTYSGGLLRHQREVHKMHLSTKQPLFCPFSNCNRSSGAGFTRKENLEEHKRRRHVDEIEPSDYIHTHTHTHTHNHDHPASKSGFRQPTAVATAAAPVSVSVPRTQDVSSSPSSKRRKVSTLSMSEAHSGHTVAMAMTSQLHVATTTGGNATVAVGVGPSDMTTQTQTQTQTTTTSATTPTQQLVQRLRDELLRKEDYIRLQSAEIMRLQNFVRSLPPQMMFDVLQSQAQAQAQAQQAQIPGGGGDVG